MSTWFMDAFLSRKRQRLSPTTNPAFNKNITLRKDAEQEPFSEDDSTELKLAVLASLHPSVDQGVLLDVLLANNGSVEAASEALFAPANPPAKKSHAPASITYQSSLSTLSSSKGPSSISSKRLTRKGRTLHLYSPEDVAEHTPCSIIHNFLPPEEANDLLRELLTEAPTFEKQTFKVFENVVQSPHTACFYVQSLEDERMQKTEYLYNGSYLTASETPGVCRR